MLWKFFFCKYWHSIGQRRCLWVSKENSKNFFMIRRLLQVRFSIIRHWYAAVSSHFPRFGRFGGILKKAITSVNKPFFKNIFRYHTFSTYFNLKQDENDVIFTTQKICVALRCFYVPILKFVLSQNCRWSMTNNRKAEPEGIDLSVQKCKKI